MVPPNEIPEAVPLTTLISDRASSLPFDDDISDDETLLDSDPLYVKTRAVNYERGYGSWFHWIVRLVSSIYLLIPHRLRRLRPRNQSNQRAFHRWRKWVVFAIGTFISVSVLNGVFRPSYQHPPEHYNVLERRISDSTASGRGNPNNEKIFIAANIINENLIRGAWGESIRALVELLGEDNVFVSVYENDSGSGTSDALKELRSNLACNSSIVTGAHLPLSSFPTMRIPNGDLRVQRITYLAEVRNRLLQPLSKTPSNPNDEGFESAADVHFDKILFINDVLFDAADAVQLLFSTNAGSGKAEYRTACAIDMQHGIMFYDSFVVRDTGGYQIGLMFYPWFTTEGTGETRAQIQQQLDAVSVRSCWGGMVAFDAALFQTNRSSVPESQSLKPINPPSTDENIDPQLPLSFRSSKESFWEAAECCLIFADIESLFGHPNSADGTGVFLNPYVRVAYTQRTWNWLPFWRRYERTFEFLQYIVSKIGYPEFNPRRTHQAGDVVEEKVWLPNSADEIGSDGRTGVGGQFGMIRRIASPGGFCGQRRMFVMKRDVEEANKSGSGKNWEKIKVPSGA